MNERYPQHPATRRFAADGEGEITRGTCSPGAVPAARGTSGRRGDRRAGRAAIEVAVPPCRQPHGTVVRRRRPPPRSAPRCRRSCVRGPRLSVRRLRAPAVPTKVPDLPRLRRGLPAPHLALRRAARRHRAGARGPRRPSAPLPLRHHPGARPPGAPRPGRRAAGAVPPRRPAPSPARLPAPPNAARRPAARVHRQPLRLRPAAPLARPARLAPPGVPQLLAADLRHPHRRRAARPPRRGDLRPHRAARGRHRRATASAA